MRSAGLFLTAIRTSLNRTPRRGPTNRDARWATGPLLPQHDRRALIKANNVARVPTNIDAYYDDRGVEYLRHGVLLVFGARGQLRSLAGQEHGRTIPLTDIAIRSLRRPSFVIAASTVGSAY